MYYRERYQKSRWGGKIKLQNDIYYDDSFVNLNKTSLKISVLYIGNGYIYVCMFFKCFWNGLEGYRPNSW